ncbi:MAG: aspartate aminotransferase family protein [Rickettsiales bacterium]|nr:aspartate aminotransferase family protein [Rickettsiales bacterium]
MISSKLLPIHKRFDIAFSHGKGVYLYDKDNNKYLDFGAGIAVNALGHCHPNLVKAIQEQSQKLWHVSNIYCVNELNNYAESLVKQTFADYVFFCNSGAEAIECAIKTIRKHFYTKGQPEKNRIITFKGAFHGRTIATISAANNPQYLEGFGPELPGFDSAEFNNIESVKNAINKNTAGILIEPIQGERGIRPANQKFLQELRAIANEHDLLLAFDEVQCGMGRTGSLFAYEHYKVIPDIVSTAKAIGGGFPLGACLSTKEASNGMTYGAHGTTYGGNPLAMATAKAVLDTINNENLLEKIKENSKTLFNELEKLKNQFPKIINEIRGVGYMIGIRLNDSHLNTDLVSDLIKNKLLTIPAGDNVVRLLPPLIITKDHIEEAITKLRECFVIEQN